MDYAQRLARGAQWASAMETLRKGIDAHHPVSVDPYVQLQSWLVERGDQAAAEALQPAIYLYSALGRSGQERETGIRAAVALTAPKFAAVMPPAEAQEAIRLFAMDLGISLGVREAVRTFDLPQQLGLLSVAGGELKLDGSIGDTGVRIPFSLAVQSGGGMRERRIAHIFLRGRDLAGSERGFHAAIIEPGTGQVLQLGVFDIWNSAEEAEKMARMLAGAPVGSIGAFAVQDDASANMTLALEEELKRYGLQPEAIIQRREHFFGFRYSFAAIGVKGAIPGRGMQAWSPESFDKRPGHPVACLVLAAGGGAP